jgi:hypothetical protein
VEDISVVEERDVGSDIIGGEEQDEEGFCFRAIGKKVVSRGFSSEGEAVEEIEEKKRK